jgi:hypothetical protein
MRTREFQSEYVRRCGVGKQEQTQLEAIEAPEAEVVWRYEGKQELVTYGLQA